MIEEFMKSLWAMKFWFIIGLVAILVSENAVVFGLTPLKMIALQFVGFFVASSSFLAGFAMTINRTSENMYVKKRK